MLSPESPESPTPPAASSSPLSSAGSTPSPPSPSWIPLPAIRRISDLALNLNFAASPVAINNMDNMDNLENATPEGIGEIYEEFQREQEQAAQPKPDSNALLLVADEIEKMLAESATKGGAMTKDEKEKYRAHKALFNVLKSLEGFPTQAHTTDGDGDPGASNTHEPIIIDLKNLAIGRLMLADVHIKHPSITAHFSETKKMAYQLSIEEHGCHFCVHDSVAGPFDPNNPINVSEDLGTGYCIADRQMSSEFFTEWETMMSDQARKEGLLGPDWAAKETRLRELDDHPEEMLPRTVHGYAESLAAKDKVYSKIDGMNITEFMGYRFCISCPWTQIDPDKTRTCGECVREKLVIIKHGRHTKWLPIHTVDASRYLFLQVGFGDPDPQPGTGAKGLDMAWVEKHAKKKHCMICTGDAVSICAECPLKVCGNCEVLLGALCKGWLNNLIYHYGSDREHLRNDAFLLRSDNGGY